MKYLSNVLIAFAVCAIAGCSGVTQPVNQPPNVPNAPYPSDGAVRVSTNVNLTWACTDPEDDTVIFDVYFGILNPPPLVASDVTERTYDPDALLYVTTYYWKITAEDYFGAKSEGEIWQFTTFSENDYWEEYKNASGTYSYISGNWKDPDPDKGAPWIALSSHGLSGAEARWEFHGFSKVEIETLEVGAYSYDNGWDMTGGEHYLLYNYESSTWDDLFDSDKSEGWHSITLTGTSAKTYVHDSTGVVNLSLYSGYSDHSHIREVFCKQKSSTTPISSPGTMIIKGGIYNPNPSEN